MNTAPIHVPNDADVAAAIERSKREILDDIRDGHVPATVSTFGELHDYTDANEYGGLCDSDMNDGPDWTPSDDYATDEEIEAAQRAGARVQQAVHEWLVAGRPDD